MWPLVTELRKIVGQPRNYGPTEEERAVIQAKEAVEEVSHGISLMLELDLDVSF